MATAKVTKTATVKKLGASTANAPAAASKSASAHKGASQRKLAVVLVRGEIDLEQPLKKTLRLLGLHRKNHCVVVDDAPITKGMLAKVKDYVTWGVVTEETYNELISKRGKEFKSRPADRKEKYNYRVLEYHGKKYKPYFALNPPLKGFGRKGVKVAFKAGGGIGDRGDKINDLLLRMI